MYRILYRFLASLARLTVRSGRSKDLEIIVLRYQLGVLRRQGDRPDLADDDRSLLGVIAAARPRPRRIGWLVTPDTLLRWHQRSIADTGLNPTGHQDGHRPRPSYAAWCSASHQRTQPERAPLEAVHIPGRVGFGRSWLAQHPTQV